MTDTTAVEYRDVVRWESDELDDLVSLLAAILDGREPDPPTPRRPERIVTVDPAYL